MKSTHIIKYIPIIFILLFTIFGIPWKKHLEVLTFRSNHFKRLLLDYVDQNITKDDNKRNCVRFVLPPDRKTKAHYPDTLDVYFSKNIFKAVAITDYDAMKYSWDVGYVEYKNNPIKEYWTGLIPRLNREESFTIPITIKNGRLPKQEIFYSLLPIELREDSKGNKARVIL